MSSVITVPPAGTPLRVVLDTNVVMAFWHFCDPKLLSLLGWLRAREAVLLTRSECLIELERVLAYRQFGIAPEKQVEVLAAVRAASECLPDPTEEQMAAATALPRCKDRDDQKFLQLAWEGDAQLLITRDKMLLALNRRPMYRERLQIVTPERLIKSLVEAGELAPA
ncbi:putative toxin-antitoxin system toxin component, PIN family [Viridibacterium curvum]|uniref:PIN domain-containing protein n=1 Tax=Viridibacterium curvum TaxID=1101404 RepID=A0ABP9QMW7_9RHOO